MQLRITFRLKYPNQYIPLSYQYELSSWIYKCMENGDATFAQFLHDHGYAIGHKRFKFFTFSNLDVPEYTIEGNMMCIQSRKISMVVSFLVDEALQHLVVGMFQGQHLRLGNAQGSVEMNVHAVQVLPLPKLAQTVRLITSSPLVVEIPTIRSNGKMVAQYLSPEHPQFQSTFFKNLEQKLKVAQQHGLIQTKKEAVPPYNFILLNRPKSKLIQIHSNRTTATKIRAFRFKFEITAPTSLIYLGLFSGFGQKNAMGFGATRLVR